MIVSTAQAVHVWLFSRQQRLCCEEGTHQHDWLIHSGSQHIRRDVWRYVHRVDFSSCLTMLSFIAWTFRRDIRRFVHRVNFSSCHTTLLFTKWTVWSKHTTKCLLFRPFRWSSMARLLNGWGNQSLILIKTLAFWSFPSSTTMSFCIALRNQSLCMTKCPPR